jgi:hypothetical protein
MSSDFVSSHFVSRDSCRCRSPVLGWLQEDPDAGAAAFLAGCQRRNRIVSAERTCVRCDGGYSGGEVSWPASWSTPRPEQRYRIPVESRTLIIRQGLKQQQSSQQVFLAVTGYLVRENVSAWGSVETLPRAMPPPGPLAFLFLRNGFVVILYGLRVHQHRPGPGLHRDGVINKVLAASPLLAGVRIVGIIHVSRHQKWE